VTLKRQDKLVFMGDSITHAHRRPEEVHDVYYLGHGYVTRIAGELNADYPQLELSYVNVGECGQGVPEFAPRWDRDCLAHRPALVSILTGINDAHIGRKDRSVAGFESGYRQLLERTRAALPGVKFVLLEPFGVRLEAGYTASVGLISEDQNREVRLRQPAVRKLAAEFSAVFVPLQDAFDAPGVKGSHWALDGIHPTSAGHCVITRRWLKAVKAAGWLPG